MLPPSDDRPDKWEDFVVFPARFLVYAPRDVRQHLHAFGKTIHRLILHPSGRTHTGMSGSAVHQELETLFAELCLIRDQWLARAVFKRAGNVLATSLEHRGVGELMRAGGA
jgi:hypothetical protein